MKILDYIFFRVYQYFESRRDLPVLSSLLHLFVTILLTGIGILVILQKALLHWKILESITSSIFGIIYFAFIIIAIIFLVIRYIYVKKSSDLATEFEKCKYNLHVKIWMIALLPIANFIVLIWLAIFLFGGKILNHSIHGIFE